MLKRGKRMEFKKSELLPFKLDTINNSILEIYQRADDSERMDMYMTYRDLREQFEEIEVSSDTQSWRC